ncbi:hypothetical protein R2E40_10190 [Aeromonas sp. CD]|uniref:hypothetical protein n=1 Tax=Aeromonas TaxID=642 RepID=UPI002966641F|nr:MULTISPECIES: hypothetical protein [Aeromonas]WOX54458.1 hypothetical protein R2E40_10190 [Aeromonas sp. CD]
MNIVTQQFTKEQYKALYEAQQLGVRFDCWLLAPGQRINTQVPLADETKLVSPRLTKCHPVINDTAHTINCNDRVITDPEKLGVLKATMVEAGSIQCSHINNNK